VADVFDAIVVVPGWERDLMDTLWGNHPTDAGYAVIRDTFYDKVAEGLIDGSLY
jgi:hypothetical protein